MHSATRIQAFHIWIDIDNSAFYQFKIIRVRVRDSVREENPTMKA